MKSWIIAGLIVVATAVGAGSEPLTVMLDQLRDITEPLVEHGQSTEPRFDKFQIAMVEGLSPQAGAQRALELAINRYSGAPEYVMQNATSWRGHIEPTAELDALITTAINSPLIEVRMAGFEVHLAQYNLEKSSKQVDHLIDRLQADPIYSGPWALWSMAVIGARGVDRERIFDELLLASHHSETGVRRWAVDSLAKFGGVEVIDPLLAIAFDDQSPAVRERAFCGLAQSGTLHAAERYAALPGLLAIAQNPQSSDQTLDWTYRAMREISGVYELPDEPLAWESLLIDLDLF